MNYKVVKIEQHFELQEQPAKKFYLDILNEETPCDGCVHAQKCAEKRRACFAFAVYVANGTVNWTTPRRPTRRTYARIMWREDGSLMREVNKYIKEHDLA